MIFFMSLRWAQNKLSAIKSKVSTHVLLSDWKRLTKKVRLPNVLIQTDWLSKGKLYRNQLLKGVGALGMVAAVTLSGNQYVESNTFEVYHVFVNDKEAGYVSNPEVVDEFKLNRYKRLLAENPKVHMILNTNEINIKSEKAFKLKNDDTKTVAKLEDLITAHAVGTQLVVEGKVEAIVKDKETAEKILDQIKSKYAPVMIKKDAGRVGILSQTTNAAVSASSDVSGIQKVDFVENVNLIQVVIDPKSLMKPEDVVNKLVSGDVQPTKYTVVEGDCVSCIAKKLGISKQLIYLNNPTIVDDKLKLGQQLDLTLVQPTLSVRTQENVIENQEVQFDTEVQTDDAMRAGETITLQNGKNGMKKVTIQITKVNGLMMDEQMVSEEIVVPSVKAVIKKGTKVIKGEGTGKFAWPVIGSSLSSGFGTRWGQFHKGIDLTSGNRSIIAADNGKVIYAGYKSDYGNHIIIDHLNGYVTLYGHMNQLSVVVGKTIEKGEKIGLMGNTGNSTGVHLHFEVRRNGNLENPLKYLNR